MSYIVSAIASVSKWGTLRREATLDLPYSSKPATAVADGIVTHDLLKTERRTTKKLKNLPSCLWSTSGRYKETIRPISWVFEAKKWGDADELSQAERQVAMYMTTAIHHRIALGIDEEGDNYPVYGLTQVNSILRLYTGHGIPQKPTEDRRRKEIVRLSPFLVL